MYRYEKLNFKETVDQFIAPNKALVLKNQKNSCILKKV